MTKKIGAFVLLLAICSPLPQAAYALGTPSGTKIINTATATYTDGITPVTKTVSAPEIVVDNKVNLTVTSQGNLTITPGTTNQALPFTIKNEGNTPQRYALTAVPAIIGDELDNVRIYLDNNSNGLWDGGDTLYSNAGTFGDVPADGTLNILIVGDTPAGAVSGDIAAYQLLARTVDAGTTNLTVATIGANTDGVDIVFADIAGVNVNDTSRDGKHSDDGTFDINLLALNLSKSVSVISDSINPDVEAKAIPGAKLAYTIRATVTGVGTATAVVITDPIPTNVTYIPGTLALNGTALTDDATDADAGRIDPPVNVGDPFLITVNLGDMTSATLPQAITFDVTIN